MGTFDSGHHFFFKSPSSKPIEVALISDYASPLIGITTSPLSFQPFPFPDLSPWFKISGYTFAAAQIWPLLREDKVLVALGIPFLNVPSIYPDEVISRRVLFVVFTG